MEPLLFDTAMDFKEFLNSFLQTSFLGEKKNQTQEQPSVLWERKSPLTAVILDTVLLARNFSNNEISDAVTILCTRDPGRMRLQVCLVLCGSCMP